MACGSSWEVDLRSDADCTSSLGRCHPRYALGWRTNEVQLYHEQASSLPSPAPRGPTSRAPLPSTSAQKTEPAHEYVHAYCDVWTRGRVDTPLASPIERPLVREACERRRRLLLPPSHAPPPSNRPTLGDCVEVINVDGAARRGELTQDDQDATPYKVRFDDDGSTSPFLKEWEVQRCARPAPSPHHVLLLIMRGQSHGASLSSLPSTLRLLRRLDINGSHTLASYARYAATPSSNRALFSLLFHGRADPSRGEVPSLWALYRSWGYASAYLDASCESDAARAAGKHPVSCLAALPTLCALSALPCPHCPHCLRFPPCSSSPPHRLPHSKLFRHCNALPIPPRSCCALLSTLSSPPITPLPLPPLSPPQE